MKTIQMTIDDALLKDVDALTTQLNTTRSAFIREALEAALRKHNIKLMEQQDAEAYALQPVTPGEFDVWYGEQVWDEE